MRNLARLTNAANRLENGPRVHDARRAPKCGAYDATARAGRCRRSRLWLGGENYGPHCHEHATVEERQAYYAAWREAVS